ncbi:MAG: hypothetical protein K8F91_14870, partial [Candidatus Obscuribacterales bacterium]|nr:hypothetical protein [Candidatus Obscuribacterales bacterium]
MSSVKLKTSINTEADYPSRDGLAAYGGGLLAFSLVFLLALAIRLWFAFFDGHQALILSCDASEYLRDARAIEGVARQSPGFWRDSLACLLGIADPATVALVQQGYQPLEEMIVRAGAIFPLFIFSGFALIGSPVEAEYIYAPLVFQIVLTSLSCVLIS